MTALGSSVVKQQQHSEASPELLRSGDKLMTGEQEGERFGLAASSSLALLPYLCLLHLFAFDSLPRD